MTIYCAATTSLEKNQFLARLVEDHAGLRTMPALGRMPQGKPYLMGHREVNLSYSHSGCALFGCVSPAAVGADIELVRPRRADLPGYVLSAQELNWYTGRGSQWEDFYALWTLKEARVKCTGEGLRGNPQNISVPLLIGDETRDQGFTWRSYRWGDYIAAVCVEGRVKIPEIILEHDGGNL